MPSYLAQSQFSIFKHSKPPPHASHPDFGHLILLVFEAVLEVVCVSLPGYIVARQGMFDAEAQKFVANLNVMLFTPCLIFTKLASQLTAEKLLDLAVIPFIFAIQTLVSYLCARVVSKMFGFKKRPQNFVVAMGVFGNSNSLPISLVLSLSQTIAGLHWDNIPGDNDDEVAARGILYLLIFQQLGQLVRWTWGYNVLLAPPESYEEEERRANAQLEGGEYRDDPDEDSSDNTHVEDRASRSNYYDDFQSGEQTPANAQQYSSSINSKNRSRRNTNDSLNLPDLMTTPANGNNKHTADGARDELNRNSQEHYNSFPAIRSRSEENMHHLDGMRGYISSTRASIKKTFHKMEHSVADEARTIFHTFPRPLQRGLRFTGKYLSKFFLGLWSFMNPPLWAMLVAIVVASVPSLQRAFFSEGSFVANSVTRAISQNGGVAVPLILVVLGANLARNTLPKDAHVGIEDEGIEKKLLIASLVSRMLLPLIVMAPILALIAKYVPVSILDDPIFVIVCFLLTGAPSALQLAQICQINGVYMGAMSRLLFQSYVVWYVLPFGVRTKVPLLIVIRILPSTLVLVMCALEVVEWAKA
jgi:predicted permease